MTARGPRCLAKRHRSELRCQLPAGWGTPHPGHGRCKLHGGSAPSGRVAGLTAQAAAELERLEVAPVVNPLAELARLAGKARQWEALLSARVAELADLTPEGGEQVHALIPLWERALDRCGSFCAVLARLDIDQRVVDIQVASAKIVAGMIEAMMNRIFDRAGFNYQPDAVRRIIVEEIEALPFESVTIPGITAADVAEDDAP